MVKKLFYLIIICLLSSYLTAQVGIGTDNPQAALHVVPKVKDRQLTSAERSTLGGSKTMLSELTGVERTLLGLSITKEDPLKVEGLKTTGSGDNLLSVDNDGVVKKTLLSSIKSEIKGEIGRGEEVTGVLIDVKYVLGTNTVNIGQGNTYDIPGVSITYTPKVNCNALVTISALPIPIDDGRPVQGTIDLIVNNNKVSSQYYSAMDAPTAYRFTLRRLGNYSTITRVVPLTAGTTYTFKLQAKSWKNNTKFNVNPASYAGAISSDSDSMKSSMTILFYSR